MREKFDFSKQEDQEKFDELPQGTKIRMKNKAHGEALAENEKRDRIVVPIEEIIPNIKPKIEPGDKEYLTIKSGDHPEPYSFDLLDRLIESANRSTSVIDRKIGSAMPAPIEKFLEGIDSMSQEEFNELPERHRIGMAAFFLLRRRFKDKVVVDLGNGGNVGGYFAACMVGAKAYIGEDKFYDQKLDNIKPKEMKEWSAEIVENVVKNPRGVKMGARLTKKTIPFAQDTDDMLMFLKRLPNNSVGIFTSGIELMNDELAENQEYREQINKEIERVLDPDSGWMIYQSTHFGNKNMEETRLDDSYNFFLLTKKADTETK